MFGFQLSYPPEWTLEEREGPSPAVVLSAPDGVTDIEVHLGYQAEVVSAAAVADVLLPQFIDLPGFRVLDEGEVRLPDGTPAYEATYRFRTPRGELRTSLLIVTRGSQSLFVRASGFAEEFEREAENIDRILLNFRLEEPAPFGIPRHQALTLFLDEGPLTLDPAIAQESQSIRYISQLFSGLVSFDPELRLVPDLAREWEVSEDGTVYTFYLRENARFHDGRGVTADDVKYSWERAALPETGSPTVSTYLGDIVGVSQVLQGEAEEIAGVEVLDDHTLRVTIDGPKAYFLSKLTHPVAFVVDRNNTGGGDRWWRQPNGTGPFRLREWQAGAALLLERNDDYYGEPARVPYVVFRFFGGIPVRMYETGEIDAAFVGLDDLEKVTDPQNPLSQELTINSELSIFYVGFNTARPPFNDPQVRRAFLLAVDREGIVNEVLRGAEEIASGFLPRGLPGHNPGLPPIPFNPEEARRLLTESSYGGPEGLPPIVYTTSGRASISPSVAAMLDMWETHLGVAVQVHLVEPGRYFYQLRAELDNLFDYGWIADYPDPHNFLDVLFHSTAENNVGGYHGEEVDRLLEQAREEQDQGQRLALYQQVERILIEDAAAIPLYFGRSYLLVRPYVEGLALSPQGGMDLRLVSLTPRQ